MSRIALDLKKFRHIKSDKNTTTLKHKDGHELTISHKNLSPEFKSQLSALNPVDKEAMTPDQAREAKQQKMVEGGKVEPQKTFLGISVYGTGRADSTKQDPTKDAQGNVKQTYKDAAQYARKAEGGEIHKEPQKYFDGTPPEGVQPQEDVGGVANTLDKFGIPHPIPGPKVDYNPQPKFHGDVGFNPEDLGSMVGHAYNAARSGIGKAKEVASDVGHSFNKGLVNAGGPDLSGADEQQPQATNPVPQDQGTAPGAPNPNPTPITPDQATPISEQAQNTADALAGKGIEREFQPKATLPGAEQALTTGIKEERAGLKEKATAEGQLATAQSDVEAAGGQAQAAEANRYRDEYNSLNEERMNHIHDLENNMVDPNKYWDSHSKIATGIGMILAGFNPTSNPNAAINFLQNQMNQNLEAQKHNQATRNSILNATMEQFKDAHAATEMARVIQNDAVAHQLLAAAPEAKSAIAQANAKAAAGKLLQDSSQRLQQLAQYKMMMGMMNQHGAPGQAGSEDQWQQRNRTLNMFNPEMAKYEAERHVPGIGEASTPVPDAAKTQMRAHKDVNNTMNEVLEFARQHAGSLDPKVRAQGSALINQLQSQIRVAEDQGVYKESEAEFMKKTIGDSPAGFLANYSTVPKVKELQELKQKSYNTLLGQYGLKPQQLPHAAQQHPMEGKTASDGSGRKIIMKNGKWVPLSGQ